MLSHTTEKLSIDWSDEPRDSQSSKLKWPKFKAWTEEATIFQLYASRDLQILETAFLLPPY